MRIANGLVIGSGVIGLAVADALARRSVNVTVIDTRAPGGGASQASAGILAPYTEADDGSPLLGLAARSLSLFDEFIRSATHGSGRQIDYARSGTLEVAFDEHESQRLKESTTWLAGRGVASEWLEASSLRSAEPAVAPDALGGLMIPAHGFVGVSSLITALVNSARRAGAMFVTPAEAVRLVPDADGVDVRIGDRHLRAEAVVIAAGSWSRRLRIDGIAALPVRPVRGQLLQLRWSSTTPQPSRVAWGPGCYAVPWPDGSLLVGATVEDVGFDESTTAEGVRMLADAAARLLPATRTATFVEARAGLRPATPDGLPAIGPFRSAPRIVAATGHYRNGILLAPLTAEIVANYLVDGVSDQVFEVTTPDRFGDS